MRAVVIGDHQIRMRITFILVVLWVKRSILYKPGVPAYNIGLNVL